MSARGENRAALMLVAVTALWGVSFTWSKGWQTASEGAPGGELLSALTLIALRMPLALLLFGACRPGSVLQATRAELRGGSAIGAVFFAGFALQTWGMASTTPALSAFFTCLCSAWAPLLGLVFLRARVAPLTLLGLVLALAGCSVLVEGWNLGKGEWLTTAASFFFGVQVLVLDRLGKRLEPAQLTAGFLGATGGLAVLTALVVAASSCGVGTWLEWLAGMLARRDVAVILLCQAVFGTALAFHWMNTYQPLVSPSKAALIYLLEPVFTPLVSIPLGHDQLTYPLVIGGLLILVGNGVGAMPLRGDKPASTQAITDKGSG